MGDAGKGGPAGAKEELSRRLREAMAGRGWRQSDLVREAGLSKGAVSNALNPAQGSPSVYSLEQLVRALGVTGEAQKELHRLRARAGAHRAAWMTSWLHVQQFYVYAKKKLWMPEVLIP